MIGYFENIIPKLQSLSMQLDKESLLKKDHWVIVDEQGITPINYLFRDKDELLISINGNVIIGSWEYIPNDNLLIKIDGKNSLFKNHYYDNKIIVLQKGNDNDFTFLVNKKFLNDDINSYLKIELYFKNRLEQISIDRKITAEKSEVRKRDLSIIKILLWSVVITFFLFVLYDILSNVHW